MIGQQKLLESLKSAISAHKLSRFIILSGSAGSGRKTVFKTLAGYLNCACIIAPDCSVDTVRTITAQAYKVTERTLYVFADADDMSNAARNALLKVVEEPPNNAYFGMTLLDTANTLATMLSRATVHRMEPYSIAELQTYCKQQGYNDWTADKLADYAKTCGQIDVLSTQTPSLDDYIAFANKVCDNVAETSGANALKLRMYFDAKNNAVETYDLSNFLQIFHTVCFKRMIHARAHNYHDDAMRYAQGLQITSKISQLLIIKSLNQLNLFDSWLLQIREAWM